jgi:hypothetical protein
VATEAGHADNPVWTIRPPAFRCIGLLPGELRQEEAQALKLLRVQQAVKHLVVVLECDNLSLRDVAFKIRTGAAPKRSITLREIWEIDASYRAGWTEVRLPELSICEVVVIELGP